MATAYEPQTHLADRLFSRNERGPTVGFGSNLFKRLGLSDPYAGGDVSDRALTEPRLDYLSSRAYLAELRGMTKRRFQLLDRIAGIRRSLSSHRRFQQRISTRAVRAVALGLDETTLIDWSTQIEDDGAEELHEVEGESIVTQPRSTGRTEQAMATRVLRSEITNATGVLAQLQGLLDAQRSNTDRGLQGRLVALQQQSPTEAAEGAHRMARELRGVAKIAQRSTGVGRRVETSGQRPLAVAQQRQAEGGNSKGLRRVLGESPVIMTLEESEAPVVAEQAPPVRASARPRTLEQPPRATRETHAGRVAPVAEEARSQGSVGRAGPPVPTAATPSASQNVVAPQQRSVRPAARPTERVARAAVAASNAPLTDVRRGLKAAQAPVRKPASRWAAPLASISEPEGSPVAPMQASIKTGLARTAARAEAGLADGRGRVTGATRYLAEPQQLPVTRQVAEYDDAVFRRFDVAESPSDDLPTMAIARNAPHMAVPEAAESSDVADAEVEPPSPRRARHVGSQPARAPVRALSRSTDTVLPALPPVARAMQRSTPVHSSSEQHKRVGIARPAVVPQAVSRARTGSGSSPMATLARASTPAASTPSPSTLAASTPSPSTPVASTPAASTPAASTPVASTPAASTPSISPIRGALRTTVGGASLRAETSAQTGIARRSRALPTVRAAARTLSQERWGTRGRLLTPSVSRFVDTTDFDDVEADAAGRPARSASLAVPAAVAVPTLATLEPELDTVEEDLVAGPVRRPSVVRSTQREVVARPLAATARAAERAEVHPRTKSTHSTVVPRLVTPFEAPSQAGRPELEARLSARRSPTMGDPATLPASALAAAVPGTVLATPEALLQQDSAEAQVQSIPAGMAERATRRGREIVPAARRSLLPSVTPEAQATEAHRAATRTERRLEQAAVQQVLTTAAPKAEATDASSPEVRSQSRVARRAAVETSMGAAAARALPEAVRTVSVPGVDAQAAFMASPFRRSNRSGPLAGKFDPVLVQSLHEDAPVPAVSDAVARVNARSEHTPAAESVESPMARAERRSQSTRATLAGSPVVSSGSFAPEVSTVQPRVVSRLAPDAVFAEGPTAHLVEGATAPSEHGPRRAAPGSSRGVRRTAQAASRASSTVRALGRSRARRDVKSMVPHPVGTPRTARASVRMLDRAHGSIAAPEGVLVQAQEVVDLASVVGDTQPSTQVLPLNERIRARLRDAPVADAAPAAATVLHDGMTLAARPDISAPEGAPVPSKSIAPVPSESIAGGRRAVGRLPGQDRSRFAQRGQRRPSRAAVESVIRDAGVLRAAERGADPVVALAGSRRALGVPAGRSARYEARVTQAADGTVMKTVVVDTVTGEEIATRQVGGASQPLSAVARAEARETSVQTVDGRPRASMRGTTPEPVVARPEFVAPEAQTLTAARAPLGQTFGDLTGQRPVQQDAQRGPLVRRRTWNRRQLAHELGEFAPAMAEAEYVEAPVASEDAPAWVRRAVSGTGVDRARGAGRPVTEGLTARLGQAEDVFDDNGTARAWEPNSLLGALSRADGPEDLIKVIVEHRTEIKTIRETLPSEAVRIVEKLASLSPEEAEMLTEGSRTLAAAPQGRALAAPRRNSRGGGNPFTQLSSTKDGHGANRIMKLADKLMGLIHLAETSRVSDAHRDIQMSQEAVTAASGDARGLGQGVDMQSLSREQLHSDVFKELHKQLEKLKAQKGEF